MPHCPPEIWGDIIGHLVLNSDFKSLKTAALICRSAKPLAQAELFRTCTLDVTDRMRVEQFANLIHENSAITSYVRHLRIKAPSGSGVSTWCLFSIGLDVFSSLSDVTQLSLSGCNLWDIGEFEAQTSGLFSSLLSVKSLSIRTCGFKAYTALWTLVTCFRSSLQYLEIHNIYGFYTAPPEIIYASAILQEFLGQSSPYFLSSIVCLTLSDIIMQDFVPWLTRSSIADQTRVLRLKWKYDKDIEATSSLLRACKSLEYLTIDMSRQIDFAGKHQSHHCFEHSNLALNSVKTSGLTTRAVFTLREFVSPVFIKLCGQSYSPS
jgi:hypothetical protein